MYDLIHDDSALGDPRRCRAHPNIATSSADGMFDAPCGQCEYEMSLPTDEELREAGWVIVDGMWTDPTATGPFSIDALVGNGPSVSAFDPDDIPF